MGTSPRVAPSLHLPVDFYFPMMGTHVCSCHIPAYVERSEEALQRDLC